MKQFGYPETNRERGVSIASKTHRLPDGKFEAVAAIFAWGKRGLTVFAVASSRRRALREAVAAIESQRLLDSALADGRVSLSCAGD